ncbi:hypothetical protein [Pseudomonas sp. McL0111]|uniref:hypothetical protein n=1 Tax=Pseudomonas sp. McL0111 TaxID=3457357 RepID=UPI00403ED42B
MNTELTEEEMRLALFGNPAPAEQISATPVEAPQSDIALAQPVSMHQKKKVAKAFTPRLKVCSGLMKPDTHLGENARQIEVSDDQTTPFLFC